MARLINYCAVGLVGAVAFMGCGGESSGSDVFTEVEAKNALRQLPYRYKFRSVLLPDGADSAVAGYAIGPHDTKLNFGIAFGPHPGAVPVPRAGTDEVLGYRGEPRFVFTNDLQIRNAKGRLIANPRFKSAEQWSAAIEMEVAMTNSLCMAATGDSCQL